ncbi:MAG TPA: UDP-glucuronic acid decarboxylase family protein [Candidatus Saccharimonadales bacterium]|nr:UDP-glucuronic acid decarboxylase family protein [Candidatus Saccharimonadales bacterium]
MKTVLVAGGAGFLGTNLCAALLDKNYKVVCADNLCTGREKNIKDLKTNKNFEFLNCDITKALPPAITSQKYEYILNLASPASPPKYVELAIETLMVGSVGTKALLDLALSNKARYVHTSTSEVYGDPLVHPQPESYWGNVNSYGNRSMYDESKRFSEALIWVYRNQKNLNTGIVRIFNTYGPHMDPQDGRVVSNFIIQALKGDPITLYGEGQQTRSFCYVDDQVAGIIALMESDVEGPVNVGNPDEFTVKELADEVLKQTGSKSKMVHMPLPPDDPTRRQPNIELAKKLLNWQPKVNLQQGLKPTIVYFKGELGV